MRARHIAEAAATVAGVGILAIMSAGPASAQAEPSAEVDPDTVTVGGSFEILVDCGEDSDGASVSATTLGGPSNVVMDEVEGNPGVFFTGLTVPDGTMPGTYELGGTCADGSGWTVGITVAPKGAAATGTAESEGIPTSQVAIGLAGVLTAVAASGWSLQRRRALGSNS